MAKQSSVQTILNYPARAQELAMIFAALGFGYDKFSRKSTFKRKANLVRAEIKSLVKSLKNIVSKAEKQKHEHRMLLLLQDIKTRASYHAYAQALVEHILYLRELRGDYGKADGN